MMTPMDGLAFLKVITQDGTVKAPYYIFVMTAMSGISHELKDLRERGMIDNFAIKPIFFDERMLSNIHTVIELRKREKPQEE
jgi:CheY-like chemotaxis protein